MSNDADSKNPDPPAAECSPNADPVPPEPSAEIPAELKTVHESPPASPVRESHDETTATDNAEDGLSREELLEQATKFLETESVRDAPLSEKRRFLSSKGLTEQEVEALMVKVEEEAAAKTKSDAQAMVLSSGSEIKKTPIATTPPPPQQPPLITYPEFLTPLPPPPPAPLMSPATLLKSAYFSTAIAATIYTANKAIFTPMYDSLTSARLDFSSTVLQNLSTLTSRLHELAPSPVGTTVTRGRTPTRDDSLYSTRTSSLDSDPRELFHMDAGTQTSPSLGALQLSDDDIKDPSPEGKLEDLNSQLKELVTSHSDGTDNELTFLLEDLTSYLEGLSYNAGLVTGAGGFYGGYAGQLQGGASGEKMEMTVKVRQEIRSIKGVLLNTKNFPAGR